MEPLTLRILGTRPLIGEDVDGKLHTLSLAGLFNWNVHEPQVRPSINPCVFEPKRMNDPNHHCDLCDTPGVVYVAFYGRLPKVGMTMAGRLETRLQEQGADAGFQVASCPGRAETRQLEQSIAYLYRLPEWRRATEVLPRLAKARDIEGIEKTAAAWQKTLGKRFDVGPLVWLPGMEPLAGIPSKIRAPGTHSGRWIGAHGNHLFYAPNPAAGRLAVGRPPVLALSRYDLEGRWVDILPTTDEE